MKIIALLSQKPVAIIFRLMEWASSFWCRFYAGSSMFQRFLVIGRLIVYWCFFHSDETNTIVLSMRLKQLWFILEQCKRSRFWRTASNRDMHLTDCYFMFKYWWGILCIRSLEFPTSQAISRTFFFLSFTTITWILIPLVNIFNRKSRLAIILLLSFSVCSIFR